MRTLRRLLYRAGLTLIFGWTSVGAAFADPPTLSVLSPNAATAGGGDFTLLVNGLDFTSDAVLQWNGDARSTTFVSATQLTASIAAADIAATGMVNVTVVIDQDTSGALTFTITNDLVPTINNLVPDSFAAGSAGGTLTVIGTNFDGTSVVHWNGTARVTSLFSPTTLEATISGFDLLDPGTVNVTVVRASTLRSNTFPFEITVSGPPPVITSINPTVAVAGSPTFSLSVSGRNFSETSVVRWDGFGRETAFVDNTTLSATILASDIALPGVVLVTVFETAPGGNESNEVTFVINPFATVYFAQVVVGGGFTTVFTLVNTGIGTATGSLVLTDKLGAPLSVDLTEVTTFPEEPSESRGAIGSSFPIELSAGATKVYTSTAAIGNGSAQTGWGRVESRDGFVSGVSTFKFRQNGALRTLAGVLGSSPLISATIPVDSSEEDMRFVGFALASINSDDMNVQLILLDEDGVGVGIINPAALNPLPAGHQISMFVHELFPSQLTFTGSLVLITQPPKNFVVVALLQEEGLLTVTPVIDDHPPLGPAQASSR